MPPEAAPVAGARPRDALLGRVGGELAERATPLLVKEVRQALRGKWFRAALLVSLTFTTLAGLIVLGLVIPMAGAEVSSFQGTLLFGACFGGTALAAAGIVPFAAFSSMNAEAEENTLELLLLSNLSPLAIVGGKVGSAVIQALLVCSTALPFAVVAWTLGGLPPSVLVLAPLFTVLGAACFSAIGIALSSVSRTRWVRVVLMVLFGFFLFNVAQNVLVFAFLGAAVVFLPGAGSFPLVEVSIVGSLASIVFLAIAVTFASDLLSHREESGSTPMRVTVLCLAALGVPAVFVCGLVSSATSSLSGASTMGVLSLPASASAGLDLGVVVLACVLGALVLPLVWCCTESERLPLGPRARPPRRGWTSFARVLVLSGGGRGALLVAVLLAALGGAHVAGTVLARGAWSADATRGIGLVLYAWIVLGLPTVVFSPFSSRVILRVVARCAVWFFPWAALLGTTLVYVVVRGPGGGAWENPANPVWLLGAIDSNGKPEDLFAWAVLAACALLTLAANAWRMYRGVREVRVAMTERDALERKVLDAAPQP